MNSHIPLSSLEAIVFDFDGVLTDDRVWVDQDGREMVCCSRRDGLAFDVLRKTPLKLFILSTETNPVVSKRAEKLRIRAVHGTSNKGASLQALAGDEGFSLDRTLYVGNDVNDLPAAVLCGFVACPADAHPRIKDIATYCLSTCGGSGIVREIVEQILSIDMVDRLDGGRAEKTLNQQNT